MRNMIFAGFAASWLLAATSAAAGPFGFTMGQDPASVPGGHKVKATSYGFAAEHTPRPHPDLDAYYTDFAEGVGVCRILGLASFDDNFSGTATRSRFANLEQQLTAKYGEPARKVDYVSRNALYDDAKYWLQALNKQERFLRTIWRPEGDDEVKEIKLEAYSPNWGDGGVFVEYSLQNIDACTEKWEAAEKSVL